MPIHPNARRCTFIRLNGTQCGSPAVAAQPYCYFHVDVARRRSEFKLPALENSADIQRGITEVIRGLIEGRLDRSRANSLLYALQLSLNCLSANSLVNLKQEKDVSVVQALLDQVQPVAEYEKDLETQDEESLAAIEAEEEMRVERQREDAKKSIFELDYYRKPTKAEEAEIERRVMAGNHPRKKQE